MHFEKAKWKMRKNIEYFPTLFFTIRHLFRKNQVDFRDDEKEFRALMMIYYLRTVNRLMRFIHLKIVILEIFLLLHSLHLLLRFDFIDWEKLQTCT